MYGYIYITTNQINGKRYIGKHKCESFDSKYKGSGKLLTQAIVKYGEENFSTELLESCETSTMLNEREIYWIEYYNACGDNSFYNIAKGGDGGIVWGSPANHPSLGKEGCAGERNGFYNKQHTLETRRKHSEFMRNSKMMVKQDVRKFVHRLDWDSYLQEGWEFVTDVNARQRAAEEKLKQQNKEAKKAERAILSQKATQVSKSQSTRHSWAKGLTRETDERIDRIAKAKEGRPSKLRGVPRTEETRKRISEASKGKHTWTEESYQKLKRTLDNLSPEQKELHTLHRSESHKGKHHTDAQKQRISDSLKGKNVGRKYINKEGVNKMVLPHELDEYLRDGWELGRKI